MGEEIVLGFAMQCKWNVFFKIREGSSEYLYSYTSKLGSYLPHDSVAIKVVALMCSELWVEFRACYRYRCLSPARLRGTGARFAILGMDVA